MKVILLLYVNKNSRNEISIDYPLYQSEKGRYFIGQTPKLSSQNQQALVALYNPTCSNSNIYLNAITVTNVSDLNISAEIYLKSNFLGGSVSNLVSAANTSIYPAQAPFGEIQYLNSSAQTPISGIPIFGRIVSPYSTLVMDGSQIIIGPGQSIVVYLGGYLPISTDSTIVAFGWWEERTCTPQTCYN